MQHGTIDYEGYPIEVLEQRLALLTLAELTASLNAALVGENGYSGVSYYAASRIIDRYIESGYVMVEMDDSGRVKMVHPHLYNHSPEGRLISAKTGKSHLPIWRTSYDRIMNIAIVNDHDGVLSMLLSVISSKYYDPHQHLATAAKLGRIQMVKALLTEVQERRNYALSAAAHNGNLARVMVHLASGADDLNWALTEAVGSHERDVVDFLVALGADNFNKGLEAAAVYHNLEEAERFIKLGADNFDEALQEMLEYTPSADKVAELLIVRATALDAALQALLQSEAVYNAGGDLVGDEEALVRMLIRAGADDLKGILDYLHSDDMDYMDYDSKMRLEKDLLLIFAAGRPQQNPAQLPLQH